jgi:hypothetical protein
MPSSANRRRVELPTYLHERLQQIAEVEDRTVADVAAEMVGAGLAAYQPRWVPSQTLDRFTARARRVLDLAQQEEPHQFMHNYAGTEHLLLALLREPDALAARVLARHGVTPHEAWRMMEFMIGRGDRPIAGRLEYVPRARRTLGSAVAEAERLGHDFVGTGHLLLGLVADRDSMAARMLGRIARAADSGEYDERLARIRADVVQGLGRADLVPADA